MSFDVARVQADFPILKRQVHGKRLVYLDSASSSQKPVAVLDAMDRLYRESYANVHRGVYAISEEATAAYEGARARLARFLGAGAPSEIVFTRNATEAINLVAYSWGRSNVHRGDLIVVTHLEHHSNLVPWQVLAADTDAELAFIDLESDGSLDLASLDRHLSTGRVKLLASTYVSNVFGTITPVAELARRAHAHGAKVLIDAAQAVPHLPVDVTDLDMDFLAFTSHKMVGPMGIGVLYGRRQILEDMPPFLAGGDMIRTVGTQSSTWNDLPWKFEAGTPNVGDAIALGAAVDFLEEIDMSSIAQHDQELTNYAVDCLGEIEGLRVHGPKERGPIVAFTIDGIHPHDIASLLDEEGIAVRAGHHCTQPLHELLGVAATTRASFYLYNDFADVDRLGVGLLRAKSILGQ